MATFQSLLSLKVRDENAGERSIPLHCELTFTDADDMNLVINDVVALIDPPLGGRIVEATLYLGIDVSSQVKASPQAGSYERSGATISMIDSGGKRNPVFFPTMAASKFSGKQLNDADAEVAALITALDAPVVNGTATFTAQDEDGRKFTGGYARGFRTTRK